MPVYSLKEVPKSLQIWFIVHFVIDFFLGLPLILAPHWTLFMLGFSTIEPVTSRLVGAALLGIGSASLLSYHQTKPSYSILLTLKLIWSGSAIVALLISLQRGPAVVKAILGLFILFFGVWSYYKFIKKV